MTVGITREQFLLEYGNALKLNEAAVFVGAGLSRAAGYVDWKGLLQDFAKDLKLDLEIESDLTLVAQYHLNREHQNRDRLHKKLVSEFARTTAPTEAHRLLSKLPVNLFWTSNYDTLVEDALRDERRDVRVKNSSSSLTEKGSRAGAVVYKLHGDLANPATIVITRDDYRDYVRRFPVFRDRLRSDLAEHTFLFLGFSFADPHLDLVLNELRAAFGERQRKHFVIMRREQRSGRTRSRHLYALNRQSLSIEDLENFGILTLLVDDFDEVPRILADLNLRYQRRQVFISGAADDLEPKGAVWVEEFCRLLGSRLIEEGFNIVSGFGKGIGPLILVGALEQLYRQDASDIEKRLLLKPFPYATHRRDLYTRYRESLIATAGFSIFICGNKRAPAEGDIIPSDGVLEEFEIAVRNGSVPIPIGATGWMAAELWERVKGDFGAVMPPRASRRSFNKLDAKSLSPEEMVEAVVGFVMSLRVERVPAVHQNERL